jgi:hypothetical protein
MGISQGLQDTSNSWQETVINFDETLKIGKYLPPGGGGKMSADVIWMKKYDKGKRKRGKM